MLNALFIIACLTIACSAQDNSTPPAPCSSKLYSVLRKCGGAEHAYLRCPKGYFCSRWGSCGSTPEYRSNALCPAEERDDPETIEYGFSPDDLVQDYQPQDDNDDALEKSAIKFRKRWLKTDCHVEKFHRFGKCGLVGHGNFRCKYGEWCNHWGYCSKFEGAAAESFCPKETRPNPDTIVYEPSPDDDVMIL